MAMSGASTGTEAIQERAVRLESQGLDRGKTSNTDVADYFLELKQSTVLNREREYDQWLQQPSGSDRVARLAFAFLWTSNEASQVCGSVFLSVRRAEDDSVKTLEALRDLPSHLNHRFYRYRRHGFHKSLFELVCHQDAFPDSLREDLVKVGQKCTAAKEGEVKDEKNALCKKKRVKVRMAAHNAKVKFQDKFSHGRGISDCTEKKEPLWDRYSPIGLPKKRQKLLDTLTREYLALEAQLQIVKSECYGLHKHMQSNNSLVTRTSDNRHDVVFVQEFTDQLTRNHNHFKEKLSGTKVQVLRCFELINRARRLVWENLASVLGSPKSF